MFSYTYPFYRSNYFRPYVYPMYAYGYNGYNNFYGINAIGSAIATNNLINTGSMFGVNQIASASVI